MELSPLPIGPWDGLHPVPPHPGPLPRGEGGSSIVSRSHPCRSLHQRPSTKHQSDACRSLSLRERVRVREKYSIERAKDSISQRQLSKLRSHCHFLSLPICFLLLVVPVLRAQSDTDSDPLPMLVHVLRGTADPELQLDILRGLSAAFKGRRQVPMPKGWEGVEAKLEGSPNADVRALAQSLSLTFVSTWGLATMRKTASDRSADLNARRTALNSLLDTKDAGLPPLLQQMLNDADLRGAAVRGLAAYDDPKTPAAILTVYNSLDGSEKRDALNTLASRAAFAEPMLAAIAQGTIPRNALTDEIIRQLRKLKNAGIDAELQKVYGVIRESSADKQKEI